MKNHYATTVLATFLALLVVGAYWAGLHGRFFFDDGPSILFAPGVKLETLSLDALRQAWFSGGAGPTGRPIAQISFAINYYVSGFDPFAFKVVNLAVHLSCGVYIFWLTRQLLEPLRQQYSIPTQYSSNAVSGMVAAVWLLHPIQLLPVLHVVQRMTSLSTLFFLAALTMHILGRECRGGPRTTLLLCAWGLLWPLSFLTKETGFLFPVVVLAWELILRRRDVVKLDRLAWFLCLSIGAALLCSIVYLTLPSARWIWTGYDTRPFTLVERLLTEARVLWLYLGLIVAPKLSLFSLHHDDFVTSTSLVSPWTTLSSMVGLVSLLLCIWWTRHRSPLVAFGIAWFLIGHAVESTILPLEIAHEHRNYLPLFGILIAGLGVVLLATAQWDISKHVVIGVSLAGLTYLTSLTAQRAHQFGDDLRRTQVEVQHHPNSARAQYEAGSVLSSLPDAALQASQVYELARASLVLASQIDPTMKVGLLSLAELDCKAGLPISTDDFEELSHRLRDTPFAPGDRNVLYALKEMAIVGQVCYTRSDVDRLFFSATTNPSVPPGVKSILHSWHADYLWLREHDLGAAHTALEKSIALNPSNLSNRLKWAQLVLLSGDKESARHMLIELREEKFSEQERVTLNELLTAVKIPKI